MLQIIQNQADENPDSKFEPTWNSPLDYRDKIILRLSLKTILEAAENITINER